MRVILDTETDVIRDFEIESTSTLEELHDAVSQSFGFAGNEMASFYRSDENWICLLYTSTLPTRLMV